MNRESMTEETPKKEINSLNRQTIIELVRLWGGVNTNGILDSFCNFFSVPEIEGFIGYRLQCNQAIALGEPVCAPENRESLAMAFQNYCEELGIGVAYTLVSKEFADWGTEQLNGISLEFGETFVLDPLDNPLDKTGPKAVILRNKVKNALKTNTIVQEYLGKDSIIEMEIEEAARAWLEHRKGPQIYLSDVNLFNHRLGKRWFYARHRDKVVGLLMLSELKSHQGWLLNNTMYTSDAPHGTSELLVISALQALAKENCRFVLIGPIPAKKLGRITGLNKLSAGFISWLYQGAKKIFHLSGHESFWEKFHPSIQPSFLLFPKRNITFRSIKALLRAFNVGR